MGKMKKQVANSDQPAITHDAFISKNKKRKEKRHLQNVTTKKVETGDFIPVKRHSLKPTPVSGLNQKGKAQLSTSLPIKGSNKGKRKNTNHSFANSTPAANQSKKVTGILSNPNTPKRNRSKNEHVTFELSANKEKILDDETATGRKQNPEQMKKLPQKSPKKPLPVESSDESDSDDDVTGEDFLDMEASEGEESDSENSDMSGDDSSEDEDDSKHENKYLSSFLNDSESESEDGGEGADTDDEDDDEVDSEDGDDDDIDDSSDDDSFPKLSKVPPRPNRPVTPAKKGQSAEQKNEANSNSLPNVKSVKVPEQKNKKERLLYLTHASSRMRNGAPMTPEQSDFVACLMRPGQPQVCAVHCATTTTTNEVVV